MQEASKIHSNLFFQVGIHLLLPAGFSFAKAESSESQKTAEA